MFKVTETGSKVKSRSNPQKARLWVTVDVHVQLGVVPPIGIGNTGRKKIWDGRTNGGRSSSSNPRVKIYAIKNQLQ